MKAVVKLTVLSLMVFVSGCSSIDPMLSKAKQTGLDAGKYVGLIPASTMKVPDYYSTRYLPKNYEMNKHYDLQHLNCEVSDKC